MRDDIDNPRLEEVPSLEEVRQVIFALDGDSAAGPDDFSSKVFTTAWEVVAHDVYKAILSFFCGAELPHFITAISIVLLPKKLNPDDFAQFRKISVCNFLNKVISRIMELMSEMGKKCRGGNLALKLDMAKAYDRVSWGFLIACYDGLASAKGSSTWGLRQGDLLSPALFIIGSEVLSHALNSLVTQPRFPAFWVPRHCPPVTHLAFVDDVIIFANGGAASLKKVMQILEWYQHDLGQLVNV
ncbi:uncharacterized protein [Coffea arabica]|uniref:Reverse transcriptase domain-containing protein n=1 Tax=Coffea arabica TaxID=13443 RepID=A0A6P6UCZ3_COFAR|nr:uncharacterized protein LOC113710030 [Coffea arabica]